MKNTELKHTIQNIRLPEDARERIIRKLEQIRSDAPEQVYSEEYTFDVKPARTPSLRYAVTALAACAVLAVTGVGVYVSGRIGSSPASPITQADCGRVFDDMRTMSVELDCDHPACFMIADDLTDDARQSGAYYVMNAEQKKQLFDLNMTEWLLMDNKNNVREAYDTEGNVSAALYLENGTYLEYRKDAGGILIYYPQSFPNDVFLLETDSDLMERFYTLFDSFRNDAERHEIEYTTHEELMAQMFPPYDLDKAITQAQDIFGNLEQAECYFSISDYGYLFEEQDGSQYFSISSEKQTELAQLFAELPYTDMKLDYGNGGCVIVMYWLDQYQQKQMADILYYDDFEYAYLTWVPEDMPSMHNCYLELPLETLYRIAELVSEPDQVFQRIDKNSLFRFDDGMFSSSTDTFTDDVQMYTSFLNDYNQEHGTELRLPTEDEYTEAGISERDCMEFFHAEFPDKASFFQYVDVLAEKGETVISNFHRVRLYADPADRTVLTGFYYFPYNASGQTYGSSGIDGLQGIDCPDLISCVGDHGTEGYFLKADDDKINELYTPPEDRNKIDEWKASLPEEYPVLNVYASDGKTLIDTFTFSEPTTTYDGDSISIDDLHVSEWYGEQISD